MGRLVDFSEGSFSKNFAFEVLSAVDSDGWLRFHALKRFGFNFAFKLKVIFITLEIWDFEKLPFVNF